MPPAIVIPDGMVVLRNVDGLLDDTPGVPGCLVAPNGTPYIIVVSVSGGKDSTALILALREAGIPALYVFADTGWEADETYLYLDYLRETLNINIAVCGVDGGMVARVRHRAGFPGRKGRFCTRELKIEPLREHHDKITEATGIETVSAIGVRKQESDERDKIELEWEDEGPLPTRDRWGGYVWRPLLRWSVDDVLEMHNRHNIKVNPLYQEGFDRVGCYPCIFENKEGIRLIARRTPQRIAQIGELEVGMVELRQQRNAEMPGRYAWPDQATFFQTRNGRRKMLCRVEHDVSACAKCHRLIQWQAFADAEAEPSWHETIRACDEGGVHERSPYHFEPFTDECKPVRGLVNHTPMNIHQIVAWSMTGDGGKQYDLFEPAPRGGCMRWGLCDLGSSPLSSDRGDTE